MSTAARGQEPSRQEIVLDFEGSKVFSKEDLLEVAKTCLAEVSKSSDEDGDSALDYCLRRVKDSLLAKGYLGAELSKPRQERTENGLKTIVSVDEGALYRLGEVEITGSRLFSSLQIREIMGLKSGDIAHGNTLMVGLNERVKNAYGDFGYIQYTAELIPKFHFKNGGSEGVVDFVVNIDEGELFKIRSIKFEGNGNVPEDALQREMLVRVGDVFNKGLFDQGLQRISQTGQFEEIDVDRDVHYGVDNESPRLDLTIHLKKKATTLRMNANLPAFSAGAIQGRVLNDQGKPVSGARVVALPLGPGGGLVPVTHTDKRGRFLFHGMSKKEYGLYAFKEEKASRLIFAHHFSNDPRVVRVNVQEDETIKDVELQLLPRQARVLGQFVNSETGRPVETAQLKLCHFGVVSCTQGGCDECVFLSANRPQGGFWHLAPSNISLTLKVSVPGYEDWYYGNSSNRQEHLVLAPGELRKLEIALRPLRTTKN